MMVGRSAATSLMRIIFLMIVFTVVSYWTVRISLNEVSRWVGTEAVGNTTGGAALLWWGIWAPFGLATGVFASTLVVASIRSLRKEEPARAILVFLFGAGLWTVLWFGIATLESSAYREPKPDLDRQRPTRPTDLFSAEQWREVEHNTWLVEDLGPLNASGVGLVSHPFVIPFDDTLLERFTFLGLSAQDVRSLFGQLAVEGPPERKKRFQDPTLSYKMCCPDPVIPERPSYGGSYWVLRLTLEEHSSVVRREQLQKVRPVRGSGRMLTTDG